MQENTVFGTVEVMDEVETVRCTHCEKVFNADDATEHNGENYCEDCFEEVLAMCYECYETMEKDNAHEVNGRHYCNECFEETFTTCESCGEIIRKDESHGVDCDCYCEDCFYESFSYCERCGEAVANDDSIWFNETIYCDSCISEVATRCEDCGEWCSETITTADDREICWNCYENDYFTCEGCGNVYSTDRYGEDGYCDDCVTGEDSDSDTGAIMGYGTTPELCFHHTNNEAGRLAFMGVELEIDEGGENNEKAKAIRECFDDNTVYFNHDGSLNKGFEIISHPFTLGYYRETLSTMYKNAMSKAVSMGYRSHDTTTCGLHVHVSRLALGDTTEEQDATLGKLWFMTKKFWPELVKFSRRKEASLNRWAAPLDDVAAEVADHDDAATMGKKVKEKGKNGRYRAINTQNSATVEFRIFRGTLNHRTFTATLELVHAMVTMARRVPLEGLKEYTFRDLIETAHGSNVGGYKALYEYAYEKKFFAVA